VEVVVDLHLRPYYGDEDDTAGLYHSEVKRGTTAFHAYATLYGRLRNKPYTLAVRRLEDGDTASSVLAQFLKSLDSLDLGVKAVSPDPGSYDSKCLTLLHTQLRVCDADHPVGTDDSGGDLGRVGPCDRPRVDGATVMS
jgi:hypothetical protein